jgi:hypothetical protein
MDFVTIIFGTKGMQCMLAQALMEDDNDDNEDYDDDYDDEPSRK